MSDVISVVSTASYIGLALIPSNAVCLDEMMLLSRGDKFATLRALPKPVFLKDLIGPCVHACGRRSLWTFFVEVETLSVAKFFVFEIFYRAMHA